MEVTSKHYLKSGSYNSARIRIREYDFVMPTSPTFVTDMDDYTILSNFDITQFIEQQPPEQIRNRGSKRTDRNTKNTSKDNNSVYPLYPDSKISKNNNTVISHADITKTTLIMSSNNSVRCVPKSIREKLERHWIHAAHIQTFSRSLITRDRLRSRVTGGQILAYHFKECDIGGNKCIYYGFLPTMVLRIRPRLSTSNKPSTTSNVERHTPADPEDNNISENKTLQDFDIGGHFLCRLNTQRVWPRYVYVRITKECACSCLPNCVRVSVLTRDDISGSSKLEKLIKPKNTYCIRQIPWEDVYPMMGSNNDSVVESLVKENRLCKTCAQCRKCSNSPEFCRDHKVCRHKKPTVAEGLVNTTKTNYIPKIKKCKRVV